MSTNIGVADTTPEEKDNRSGDGRGGWTTDRQPGGFRQTEPASHGRPFAEGLPTAPGVGKTRPEEGPGPVEYLVAADAGNPPPAPTPGQSIGSQQNLNVGNNYGIAASFVQIVQQKLGEHLLQRAYVTACVEAFVAPEGIEDAASKLRLHRIVVLVADANYGRHDAAVNLLHAVGGLNLREVSRETGDTASIEAIPHKRNSGWILDLRADESVPYSFGRSLRSPETRHLLELHQSYVVVIAPPRLWQQSGSGGEDLVHLLRRPAATKIVEKRLQGRIPSDRIVSWISKLTPRLRDVPPAEARKWAHHVAQVESVPDDQLDKPEVQPGQPAPTPEDLRERMVLAAAGSWWEQLLEWYKAHPDCQVRDFLLAAAVLEGCEAGRVFTSVPTLSEALRGPTHQASGQQGPGIFELVDGIGARLVDGYRIQFNRPGYGEAVLDYFWGDRQHLQSELVGWMCTQALNAAADGSSGIVDRVATYVLRWTLRSRDLKFLVQVAESWSEHPDLMPATAGLLTAVALDPNVGKAVRDQLLDWAKPEKSYRSSLRRLVATVCGGDLALVHPKLMIFRLGNLAQNEDATVTALVQEKIAYLWQQPRLRTEILNQIRTWLNAQDRTQMAGRTIFLMLTELKQSETPELLAHSAQTGDPALEVAARGWRAILEDSAFEPERRRKSVFSWLDAAAFAHQLRSALFTIATNATAPRHAEDENACARLTMLGDLCYWRDQPSVSDPSAVADLYDSLSKRLIEPDRYLSSTSAMPKVSAEPSHDSETAVRADVLA